MTPRCASRGIVAERLKPISIIDVLLRTEQWLNWTRFFTPLSGHEAKLDDPIARYITTAFCYGCNYVELPLVALENTKGIERQIHIMQVM